MTALRTEQNLVRKPQPHKGSSFEGKGSESRALGAGGPRVRSSYFEGRRFVSRGSQGTGFDGSGFEGGRSEGKNFER